MPVAVKGNTVVVSGKLAKNIRAKAALIGVEPSILVLATLEDHVLKLKSEEVRDGTKA